MYPQIKIFFVFIWKITRIYMAKILHKNMKFIVKNKYQTDKLLVYTPLFILHFDPFINALLKKN